MLSEFIVYLIQQIGQPYLWGGQHTKLTPANYKAVIARKESKPENRKAVEEYCEAKFRLGYDTLYAYDCSGLGVYWLCDLQHLYKSDVNSNTMKNRTKLVSSAPKRGYWLFKCDGSRAYHIGYMINDTELIEAKGRKYGVCKSTFREKDWSCWGIPLVFEDEIVDPPAPTDKVVLVVGGRVHVRKGDNKNTPTLTTVLRGDELPYLGTAESGWYHVRSVKGDGYITNVEKYTKLLEE